MAEDKDWFQSWFNSPYYHILYKHRNNQEAMLFIDALLDYLKPKKQAEILDLACGSGRHSIYIASKGYNVTGTDLSGESIEKALKHKQSNLSFFVHDMRNEFRINYFDYTFNFFTSFGYFESDHDNFRALENVCKGLKKNGTFVIDFFNVEKVKANLVPEENKTIDNIEFRINRYLENGFVIKKIEVKDGNKTYSFYEKVQGITIDMFKDYFYKMCFSVSTIYGNYNLAPFDIDSDRLIIVAKKSHD